MKIYWVFIIICILSCLSCLSSCGSWIYTANNLNEKRMCNTSKNINTLYCPLNQELVSSYIYNDSIDLYYNPNYIENYNTRPNHSIYDYFNTYFSGGTPPPIKGKDYFMYCTPDVSLCGSNMNKLDVTITEDIIYKGYTKEKLYFYCDINFITNVTQKRFNTLQEFLNECSKYSSKSSNIDKCSSYSTQEEMQKMQTSCLFFGNFYSDSSAVIKTLSNTILSTLNNELLKEYFSLLTTKMQKNKKMTTFEFFMYLAIKLKLDNIQYIVLKKNIV